MSCSTANNSVKYPDFDLKLYVYIYCHMFFDLLTVFLYVMKSGKSGYIYFFSKNDPKKRKIQNCIDKF